MFGKNNTEKLTAIDVKDNELYLFHSDGTIEKKPYKHWGVFQHNLSGCKVLKGNAELKYLFEGTAEEVAKYVKASKQNGDKYFRPWVLSEQAMIRHGYNLFKNMKIEELKVFSFDIETNGLKINHNSQVYIISTSFQHNGKVERKMFSVDEYGNNQIKMINDFCKYVRQKDPDVFLGHNIYGFDLPFLLNITDLHLGRDGSKAVVEDFTRKKRKDASQQLDYNDINIFGRQVIDTMFLAITYDFARKYDSYALKTIIKQEGLEVVGRQHYDASKIKDNWGNYTERIKIKKYAEHDADDALALFNLMSPMYFYYTRDIPMSFQRIINTASGSQLNNFLIRQYIQDDFSIPLPKDKAPYEGAITFGKAGVYDNVFKVDVASMYPNIMIQYNIKPDGDYNDEFTKMVKVYTEERLKNKALGQSTGDPYYKQLEQTQKLVINSAYGLMGAGDLHFNSPHKASEVTRRGREILQKSIDWAESLGYFVCNCDTDSIAFTNSKPISVEKQQELLVSLNSLYPEYIKFTNDGYFSRAIIVKAKNYLLYDGVNNKKKQKGSAFKDSKKEPALKEMLDRLMDSLIHGRDDLIDIYHEYVREVYNIKDISRWVQKKTVTKSLLTSNRTNEKVIRDCIDFKVSEGDKIWTYPVILGKKQDVKNGEPVFLKDGTPKMVENKVYRTIDKWDGLIDHRSLLKRLIDSVRIIKSVTNAEFENYSLKTKQKLVDKIINM